jgi:hypothetical protein
MKRVTKSFLKRQNIDQMIMPLTNYLEYLFVNILAPNKEFVVKDPYVLGAYATILGQEKTDRLKEAIKSEAYDFFGGQSGFESMAKSLMSGVFDEALKITDAAKINLQKNRDNVIDG